MDWLPAITTTSLLALALWLTKSAILERLKGAVQHEFNEKLEKVKTELREKENQITALRAGALSGASHRQVALYERKLKAAEKLWSAVNSLSGGKGISSIMAAIKFEAAARESARNPLARKAFEMVGKTFDLTKVDFSGAYRARPFVSRLAWAYYSAYQSIIFQSVIRLEALKAGTQEDFSKGKELVALVLAALPHHKSYFEENADQTLHYLLDELEEKVLLEIEKILNGELEDEQSLERAAKILKASEILMVK
ncbi:MAG: hypothetical protein Q7T48_00465 [Cellvibrio sp.]|uniref:hypothetical protein n=1 Tax=Cellvibrio sp. TaxID=1965322 RepID=UPI002725E3E3|nr:hypothetical protein [Cellvibrio sp.]